MSKNIIEQTLKYESYKNSGIEWIGLMPSNWNTKRVGQVASIVNGFPFDSKKFTPDEGYPLVRIRDIKKGTTEAFYNGKFESSAEINDGDVLIGMDGDFNVAQWFGGKALLNQRVCCLRSESLRDLKFLYYCIGFPLKVINDLTFSTTVKHLSSIDLMKVKIPEPTKVEKKRIVSFLDKKTLQLDEAIVIKQKQIELLKERKQIIIQQAVTEGLNTETPMKDSGVEWVGKVPEHWLVKRAKYLLDEINERSESGLEELLSVSHITGVTPRSEKNVTMFMAEDYTGSKLCHAGDLVINIMWAWMGALGASDRTGIVSPSYGVYREQIENTFVPQYLEMLLKSTKYVEYYNKVSTGLHSSRLRFYGHMLFDMALGFPPYDEQVQIVQYISQECSKIDGAIAVQAQEVSTLKEYKATLINSAVTGKIKVTELA